MSIPLIYQDEVLETISVTRAQRIHHPYDDDISYFCHLSKNLWNQAHHLIYGYYKKYGHVNRFNSLKITNTRRGLLEFKRFDRTDKLECLKQRS